MTTTVEQAPVTDTGAEPVSTRTRGEVWAEAIRAEERGLGTMTLVSGQGMRCARGAVGDFGRIDKSRFDFRAPGEAVAMGDAYFRRYLTGDTIDNDSFDGTPLERREYMAQRVEVLE